MASRFTEHFEFDETWEQSCSPLSSPSSSYFSSSSTDTLNYQVTSSEDYLNHHSNNNLMLGNYNHATNSCVSLSVKDSSLMHSHSFSSTISTDDTIMSTATTTKAQLKLKLKRLLTNIGHKSSK